MTGRIEIINGRKILLTGAVWEPLVGYSRGVRAGNIIQISGCTAVSDDGSHVGEGDAYLQAKRSLEIIKSSVEALGGSIEDVTRTRIYVVNIERDSMRVGRAHQEMFGNILPATSMVEVAKLISPWMLVEIEAEAIVA